MLARLDPGAYEVEATLGGLTLRQPLVVFNGVDRGAVHDFEHAGHDAAGEDRIQGCCA